MGQSTKSNHIPAANPTPPVAQGLYDPFHEHDSCGVGFVAQMKGHKSHKIIDDGLTALEHLNHHHPTPKPHQHKKKAPSRTEAARGKSGR